MLSTTKVNIKFILFLFLGFSLAVHAQTSDSLRFKSEVYGSDGDTVLKKLNLDSTRNEALSPQNPLDTLHTRLWPAFIRSAIVPGWGQIEQEHPGRAVIIYGLGLSFLYNIVYNHYWYQKTHSYMRKAKFRRYCLLFLNLYAINLVDIYETHRRGEDKPWPQNMFSDQPLKSPWGSVSRSAMLPGWGQYYNESYIKSVIAFGAFSYFASRVYDYGKRYRDTHDVTFRDKRVTNSWYLGLTYFIIMVDAYVDAYLYEFDETIKLTYQYVPLEKTFTFGLRIDF